MKRLDIVNSKPVLLFIGMMIMSLVPVNYSCAGTDDGAERLSNNQSGIFSPGYINATKRKTDAIVNQLNTQKSFVDNLVDYVQNRLANDTAEDSANRVAPELRKKPSTTAQTKISEVVTSIQTSTQTTPVQTPSQADSQTGYGSTENSRVEPPPAIVLPTASSVSDSGSDSYTSSSKFTITNTDLKQSKSMSDVFGTLFSDRKLLSESKADKAANKAFRTAVTDSLESAMPVSMIDMNEQNAEMALKLSEIMKNPTEDQEILLEIAQSTLKIAENSDSPELKRISEDLLRVVADVLAAQAIPNLLKEGDISAIKSVFEELNNIKGAIMFEYQESTKPYYDRMIKELSGNMSILQLENIIAGNVTRDELAKLPPSELDKIVEKLRRAKDKSSEVEYMLRQEAKYRKAYIEPNKKVMEEKIKLMMKDFTQRLSKILEAAKK